MILLKNNSQMLENQGYFLHDGGTASALDHFYFGVVQTEERPTAESLDFAGLTLQDETEIDEKVNVTFAQEIGFPVFAMPYFADNRKSWFIKTNNRGAISGEPQDEKTKLFPNQEVTIRNGIVYKVYIGNYHTRFLEPVVFRSY